MRPGLGSFGTILRHLRTVAAISQEELAERAGLSVRGISDLERGARAAPRLETVRLLADALQLEPADRAALLAAARPEPRTPAPAPAAESEEVLETARLPEPLTSLVGRETELRAITDMLRQSGVRLLTLTGPGGVGKTRLAIAIARATAAEFAHGAYFVLLAPIRDPDRVGSAIAQALGLRELGSRSIWALLADHLRPRQVLLVLDNLEQALDAAPFVSDLLAACPRLTVLATSRAILHLSGERDIPVSPLPLPATDRPATPDDLATVGAVQLFVQRAQAVDWTFALTEENAAVIAAICQRLEGLPLAIELAAARITLLPPNAMLERLERRLPLLSGGARDQPVRQRTMRDAIAWSYDLLGPAEQTLFHQLALFEGGFTLEAAEAVGSGRDADALLGLTSLVDQTLVRPLVRPGSDFRFAMLETIREFALERLDASREGDAARAAHAAYFLDLAEQAAAATFGAQESLWLDRLEAERANLRAAQRWFERALDAERALRLAGACNRFWRVRGPVAEGRAAMERALALPGHSPAGLRVRVTLNAGELAYVEGILAADREHLSKALVEARRLDDPAVLFLALQSTGRVMLEQGDPAEAETHWAEAIALARTLDERTVAYRSGGMILEHLGFLARRRGDLVRAAMLTEEALAWVERVGFEWSAAMIVGSLAAVVREQGDYARAANLYRESLRRVWAQRDRRNLASALFGFALTVAKGGRLEPAARLYGAAEALFASDATSLPILGRPDRREVFDLLQTTLGEERFAAARAVGQDLSPEQVLALAEEIEF